MIQGMFDYGSLPALERLVQFTGARHKVLVNNIANLSTPYFKPTDLSPQSFQQALRDAMDQRRQNAADPVGGPLRISDTRELSFHKDGIEARPAATNQGILFHDQNNRDLERTMQHLAENTMTHNAAIDMFRAKMGLLRIAISGRIG